MRGYQAIAVSSAARRKDIGKSIISCLISHEYSTQIPSGDLRLKSVSALHIVRLNLSFPQRIQFLLRDEKKTGFFFFQKRSLGRPRDPISLCFVFFSVQDRHLSERGREKYIDRKNAHLQNRERNMHVINTHKERAGGLTNNEPSQSEKRNVWHFPALLSSFISKKTHSLN